MLLVETDSSFAGPSCSIIIAQYIFVVVFHEVVVDEEEENWDAVTCAEIFIKDVVT